MKQLKVGMRLSMGFGVMILFMVIIMVVGVLGLARLSDSADREVLVIYPKLANVSEISLLSEDSARVVRNLILNRDANAIAANKAALDKNRARIDSLIDTLDQAVVSDKGRELLRDLKAAHVAYFRYTDDVVNLALANDIEKATSTLYGPGYKTQSTYLGALNAMADFLEKTMATGAAGMGSLYHTALALMIGLGIVAVLVAVIAAWVITRWLLRQLGGEPADVAVIANRIAAGELAVDIDTRAGDRSSLLVSMRTMRDGLAAIVERVRISADSIATGSSQIAAGNSDLSSRTEQQAASLQETASSMEELTATVKQNADNANQASSLAANASEVADKGNAVVGQVVATITDISESSSKIAEITGIIEGIAFQTNILALNAAVEAARAGEQGRGFAVVASEVRSLAQRSSSAAKEIKDLINASVAKIQYGSKLAGEAGNTMTEVTHAVARVTDIMGEIASASSEQSRGIDQVNIAITQMDEVTQQNAALVEEAAAASKSLEDQGRQLNDAMSFFRLAGTARG
ncbi:MAG TPA: methyl-accepting chemotaxis protein [Paraburkholderia sp.]|jgi:methyl-accepting chemotaxis protein|nr:methyl-accepting chemotaxis protein [Paraburkholderia sp.]